MSQECDDGSEQKEPVPHGLIVLGDAADVSPNQPGLSCTPRPRRRVDSERLLVRIADRRNHMSDPVSTTSGKAAAVYTAMLLGRRGALPDLRHYGETLSAPAVAPPIASTGGTAAAPDILWHLLLALAAVVIPGRLLGILFRAVGQPPVIGEVVAGILLGPSLLGRVAPEASAYLLPPTSRPFSASSRSSASSSTCSSSASSWTRALLRGQLARRRSPSRTPASSCRSCSASALALYLYPRLSTSDVPFTHFALFLGVAMSITAFPVLARILTDRGMHADAARRARADLRRRRRRHRVVPAGVRRRRRARRRSGSGSARWRLTVGVHRGDVPRRAAAVRAARRDAMRDGEAARARRRGDRAGGAAAARRWRPRRSAIHAHLRRVPARRVIPHDSALARALHAALEDLVIVLLLPAFFAFTGMRTQIGLVSRRRGMAGLRR